MKKIILISLLVLFGCDDDPLSSSSNALNWGFKSVGLDGCYFTNVNNVCNDIHNLSPTNKLQFESLEVVNIYEYSSSGSWRYVVEMCNMVEPPIREDEFSGLAECEGDNNYEGYWSSENGICYAWYYNASFIDRCLVYDGFSYVEYKE